MIVQHSDRILPASINHPGVKGASVQALIGPAEGWPDHALRVIELDEGGHSPDHTHAWPHINYILEGRGVLTIDGRENPVSADSYAVIPAGSRHQFKNTGEGKFRFICIVPKEGHK